MALYPIDFISQRSYQHLQLYLELHVLRTILASVQDRKYSRGKNAVSMYIDPFPPSLPHWSHLNPGHEGIFTGLW